MEAVGRHRYRRERENPSFSSTLLDAIYRSIDERDDEDLVVYRETTREKQRKFSVQGINGCFDDDQQDVAGLRRACMIEKWMQKEVCEKVVRRKSPQRSKLDSLYFNSSSSSSDSSSGGGFSSSDAESVHGIPSRPKPIRTSTNQHDEYSRSTYGQKYQIDDSQSKPNKQEDKFVKKKSRAMKIYGDLKKVKQPISPGGRLANFLNSLFTTGEAKKDKLSSSSSAGDRKSKSASGSTCSSASSFSRSCLSKTPSSSGKLSNGTKRSVRFCPVSVIVDEDCQPCGHKSLYGEESDLEAVKFAKNSISEELKLHLIEKNRRIEEAARNLLRNYQKKVECELDLAMNNVTYRGDEFHMNEDEDDDDDDAVSCASSDLFELDNLSAIGMERYQEELPVYETTHLDTNRAIANGFFM